jgi:hypothetical protein
MRFTSAKSLGKRCLRGLLLGGDDLAVSRISDGQHAHAEELAARRAQLVVVCPPQTSRIAQPPQIGGQQIPPL